MKRARKERESTIRVTVKWSDEPIDFDQWAEQYVRACLRVLRPDIADRISLAPRAEDGPR